MSISRINSWIDFKAMNSSLMEQIPKLKNIYSDEHRNICISITKNLKKAEKILSFTGEDTNSEDLLLAINFHLTLPLLHLKNWNFFQLTLTLFHLEASYL